MTDEQLNALRCTADYIRMAQNTTYQPSELQEFARLAGLAASELLTLRAEIKRVTPYLAFHGVGGYEVTEV